MDRNIIRTTKEDIEHCITNGSKALADYREKLNLLKRVDSFLDGLPQLLVDSATYTYSVLTHRVELTFYVVKLSSKARFVRVVFKEGDTYPQLRVFKEGDTYPEPRVFTGELDYTVTYPDTEIIERFLNAVYTVGLINVEELPTLTLLYGLPGSGKSTWASQYTESHEIYSSDDINREVFLELHKRVENTLKEGKSVIVDATHLTDTSRRAYHTMRRTLPIRIRIVMFRTPTHVCRARNESRERVVPSNAMAKMEVVYATGFPSVLRERWDILENVWYEE